MPSHDVDVSRLVEQASPALDRQTWAVIGLAAALFVAVSAYTAMLYHGFWSTGSDLGSYVHMFSTTLSGQGFLSTGKFLPFNPTGSYWGSHFSLTLLLYLPVFATWPSPVTLLVEKSAVLAASIPVLWLLARHHLDDDWLAGLVVASYALNPFLWTAWLFDFQEQSLLPLFVFAAYYAYVRRWHRSFLALLALSLMTNEFVGPIAAGALLGLAVAAYRRGGLDERRVVLGVGLVMTALSYVLAGLVTSRFNEYTGIPRHLLAPQLHPFVEGGRASIGQLVGVVLAHPWLVPAVAADGLAWKVVFLVLFLVPTAFLAATDEVTVGAFVPYLAFAWLFTADQVYYVFGAHYSLYLLPFLYVGAVRVLGRYDLRGPSRRLLARVVVVAIVLSVAGAVGFGVMLGTVPHADAHTRTLQAAIDGVPANASLVTQNTVYPHVAERPHARYVVDAEQFDRYRAEFGPPTPQYVLVDTNLHTRPSDWSGPLVCAMGDRLGTEYGAYRYEDGVWVFKRGYDGPVRSITSDATAPVSGWRPAVAPTNRSSSYCTGRVEVTRGVLA